jgi:hypothetical protein
MFTTRPKRGNRSAIFGGYLCLILALAPQPARAEDRDRFADRIRAAFQTIDKTVALKKLFHLDGVDAKTMEMYDERIIGRMLARFDAPTIEFEPLPSDFDPVYVRDGYEFRPNISLSGLVVLNSRTRVAYGERDGRFYFTGTTKTAVNPGGPPDRMLQMMVLGIGAPPIGYSGHCDVMQSNGRPKRMTLEDSGIDNTTAIIMAQHIESCELIKRSPQGTLKLRLQEGETVSFEQRIARDGATIRYRK